jgi:enhancing lycopene biosynthesis protein 2
MKKKEIIRSRRDYQYCFLLLILNQLLQNRMKKIAVILSGCGVYDGSEIHEATLTLLAIARHGADYQCFAPDINQVQVINHLTGKETAESRNVLVESARIARGKILALSRFNAYDFDAVIFPGGFGAAKNLCSFAFDGINCSINPEVEKTVKAMARAGKPIGALCIAPVMIAKILGDVEVTIGDDKSTAESIRKMGGSHVVKSYTEVVVDKKHAVVTTPCYMLDASIDQIADGAENVVKTILRMIK